MLRRTWTTLGLVAAFAYTSEAPGQFARGKTLPEVVAVTTSVQPTEQGNGAAAGTSKPESILAPPPTGHVEGSTTGERIANPPATEANCNTCDEPTRFKVISQLREKFSNVRLPERKQRECVTCDEGQCAEPLNNVIPQVNLDLSKLNIFKKQECDTCETCEPANCAEPFGHVKHKLSNRFTGWQFFKPRDYCVCPQESAVGFIDAATIGNRVRFRSDMNFANYRFDRAMYYSAANQFAPGGTGLPFPEKRVDMYELAMYGEYAFSDRVSVFMEVPFRFLNPDQNARANSFGDWNTGFKVAYFVQPDLVQTFQTRLSIPIGAEQKGLGNGIATLEPALLVWQKLSKDWVLEAELRDWITLAGGDFAGNVLRYGGGLSYNLVDVPGEYTIRPVVEAIGWTVLRGQQTKFINSFPSTLELHKAGGVSIFNLAAGLRFGTPRAEWYLGYSRAITEAAWFRDAIRLELRVNY